MINASATFGSFYAYDGRNRKKCRRRGRERNDRDGEILCWEAIWARHIDAGANDVISELSICWPAFSIIKNHRNHRATHLPGALFASHATNVVDVNLQSKIIIITHRALAQHWNIAFYPSIINDNDNNV